MFFGGVQSLGRVCPHAILGAMARGRQVEGGRARLGHARGAGLEGDRAIEASEHR